MKELEMHDKMRIVQELVPGRQITLLHVIANPDPILYQKLGLDPKLDYSHAAIGVLTVSPAETAVITADIAMKSANIDLGFVDRFSGTLIITGRVSEVDSAFTAIGDYFREKDALTEADLNFDSPYNTYLHTGLTPGPIANPGMSSLEAALNPASTGYYYYVLNPATGQHTFSKTLEEHEKLVEKYRQARAN